jgi:hypothetical protein
MKITKLKHTKKKRKGVMDGVASRVNNQSIDEGWRYFWDKRGYNPPPPVSTYTIGRFILPNYESNES